jgi:hypothetical protein
MDGGGRKRVRRVAKLMSENVNKKTREMARNWPKQCGGL